MLGTAITLRILMIGNSFSVCVGKDLPQIVQSVMADNRESAGSRVSSHPQRIATSEHPEIFNAKRREHCRE